MEFLVEESQNMSRTWRVKADTAEEAQERYSDKGMIVNSETSSPEILSVTRA